MRKAFPLFVSLLLLIQVNLFAQKVAVCGFNSTDPDGFSFVALVPLGPTDIIYFTDGPYVALNNSFDLAATTDGVLQYTPPAGGVTVGDVIVVVETATPNTLITSRTGGAASGSIVVVSGNFDLAPREPIFSFEAGNSATPATTMTELYGLTGIGGPGGSTDIGDNPETDPDAPLSPNYAQILFGAGAANQNVEYNPLNRDAVTRAAFINAANWNTSNANIALSTTPFTNLTFPVEWLSFDARIQGTQVQLAWATASELNNDFFAIERSADGQHYAEIGTIQGAGTSQEVREYSFADLTPVNGASYYRIRQVDYDGAFDFSDVVRVELTSAGNPVQLYPNPVADQLQVRSGAGTLRLYTLTGQQLLEKRLEDGITQIDLSGLKAGIYLAEILGYTQGRTTHRIVK